MSAVSPARACAYAVIRRVFEQGAYADRALHAESAGLDARERSFAMQLAYGTVQRRATVDYVAGKLTRRSLGALDPPVLAALRLGLFQLLLLDGVAEHAAVNESVELVKRAHAGGAGLVNAVLRRGAREGAELLEAVDEATPEGAAIRYSVPEWLARQWWRELGGEEARALLQRINEPAESALRVNTLLSSPEEVLAQLPVAARPAPGIPEGIVLEAPFDAYGSPLWDRGVIMPQSRASMLIARVLGPQPGQRVLDLCAAPGAKTTHLAALMDAEGELVAVELRRARAQALSQTCLRMGASWVSVEVGDASSPRPEWQARFDRVLVDPPCSGLGTLQSRPDIRWRANPQQIEELTALQSKILAAGAQATAPGGTLVYSVCTISRAESVDVVESFLRSAPEFGAEPLTVEGAEPLTAQAGEPLPAQGADWTRLPGTPYLQLLPHRDRTDGFFVARLRRA